MTRKIILAQITITDGKVLFAHLVLINTNKLDRDNEKPRRNVTVKSFMAQGRPITNEEVTIYRLY